MKAIVVYDSWTGNTERTCRAIAEGGGFEICKAADAPVDLSGYDLLIAGTPDIRGAMTPALRSWLLRVKPPRFWIMVVTYGVPVWGNISAAVCAARSRGIIGAKFVGWFARPGRHAKFGTFRGRPTPRDLENDTRFGRELKDSRLLKLLLSGS